ncbi:hypothetical protein C1Y08_24330 [Pseudomonas sp. FW306-02-F02-AA]|uniref:Glycosaminoglycan attachment site n=1 Tax=Pseudomonas fluorescens TaxID=294 RepID=A0A0N9W5E3_PSEFL|nr:MULTISPECIES: hypothetical protein [Pseudomonas]ALI01655.1 hypothetical protein AO353_11425 [Pseudomonas fluorescens]PMZ01705.1 hypothetical protein C1Y07_23770 [Pseudomonas sp. FW306-02-F02-AB]PMZ07600.1 hypothetical protein C1Y06_23725 [Pseudomonas sp. FW306-02-H06C]PMZ13318.1 hypothetical protein C1Y08_24330 [Pseudomonas sp. FW306-02-F02-AA]PMZ19362.1 hypothetical protein C1Y09_24395 [Pseudomonas sp. FW306-02-F08-AA]
MDLFTPIVPVELQHPNFINVMSPGRVGEREVVAGWAEGFPDRDNKFVREFQTTFNSSFWEVYLYRLFRSYSLDLDWSHSSPDFWLRTPYGEVIVEAVTANAAVGTVPEWEKPTMMTENVRKKEFWPLNREAIIRISNALLAKVRKYGSHYQKLPHVPGKPFVIALAPFEQADFQYQYDRPMRALLYDDYVDEDAYVRNPELFPDGPPSVKLGEIEKDNGSTFDLGIFENDQWSEVSAVIFSCVATWGKTVAMSTHARNGFVAATWGTNSSGESAKRMSRIGVPSETISDGLQIFHNPYAKNPLDLRVFRRKGVVQHYQSNAGWVREGYDDCLQSRTTHTFGLPIKG